MTTLYKTEAEASEVAENMDYHSLGYCPVIRSLCRTDCISYVKPHSTPGIRNGCVQGYYAAEAYCKHPMIGGALYIEQ